MLDRDTSPRKDPLTSLSGKKKLYMVMTILHKDYSYKIHVFTKSFVYHSICMVFTILFVGSLSSHIYGLNCHYHYLYWNIDIYIYIYIYISYMWSLPCCIKGFATFPCPLKVNNGSQWWVFLTKMKKGLYQEMFENKSLPQEEFLPKISLKKISSDSQFSSNRF